MQLKLAGGEACYNNSARRSEQKPWSRLSTRYLPWGFVSRTRFGNPVLPPCIASRLSSNCWCFFLLSPSLLESNMSEKASSKAWPGGVFNNNHKASITLTSSTTRACLRLLLILMLLCTTTVVFPGWQRVNRGAKYKQGKLLYLGTRSSYAILVK